MSHTEKKLSISSKTASDRIAKPPKELPPELRSDVLVCASPLVVTVKLFIDESSKLVLPLEPFIFKSSEDSTMLEAGIFFKNFN